jgi:hypothetical protein
MLAEGFDRKHESVTRLIENYREDFENFKDLKSRKVKTKGRPVVEYWLNENQAMLLGTYLKNSPTVRQFKIRLIKEFDKLKKQNQALRQHQQQPEYQITRDAGKIVRRQTTDTIKDFLEYAQAQGSKNSKFYYGNFTKMVNGLLMIVNGRYKNLRAVMSVHQLMTTTAAEQTVVIGIKRGMKQKKFYKDIYQDVKGDVEIFAESHGQLDVIDSQLRLE